MEYQYNRKVSIDESVRSLFYIKHYIVRCSVGIRLKPNIINIRSVEEGKLCQKKQRKKEKQMKT